MTDVNYVEYASNGLRLVDVGVDATSFASQNGNEIGSLIAMMVVILLALGLTLIIIFFFLKLIRGKK